MSILSNSIIHHGVATITAYSHTGNLTSSDKKVYTGCVALSKDIRNKYRLKFGDKIHIENLGTFIYDDWMPKQWHNRIDIFMNKKSDAKRFGKKRLQVKIIK
jgi:3D (Asp-Asp-Asp) domain-containing protein